MENEFYKKFLMDHYKNPKHKKEIKNPHFSSGQNNPSCGDAISVSGLIEDGVIKDIGFEGKGCVISLATASVLLDNCIGKPIKDVLALTKDDLLKMIGVELGPNRLHCALISLESLHKGLLKYLDDK